MENFEVNGRGFTFDQDGHKVEVSFYNSWNELRVDGFTVCGNGGIGKIANHMVKEGCPEVLLEVLRGAASLTFRPQKRWAEKISENLGNIGRLSAPMVRTRETKEKISRGLEKVRDAFDATEERGYAHMPNGLLVKSGYYWYFFEAGPLDRSCRFYRVRSSRWRYRDMVIGSLVNRGKPVPRKKLEEADLARELDKTLFENAKKGLETSSYRDVIAPYLVAFKLSQ